MPAKPTVRRLGAGARTGRLVSGGDVAAFWIPPFAGMTIPNATGGIAGRLWSTPAGKSPSPAVTGCSLPQPTRHNVIPAQAGIQ
ncbi:MAG TPA: hypothetical protein PLM57_12055, partial [Candidatus Latescibacteria bacterium]|nr:hypothetical protein [Candidatus Latescibacterota bacterium]